nr:zinc-binding dehydrogenase [Actinomadura citrea]
MAEEIRKVAPEGVDAYIDTFGGGNVDIAIALGVPAHRINTVADPLAVRRYGVHGRAQEDAFSPVLVAELADLVARGRLAVPINTVYPLERVGEAYVEPARRHTRGKIVLSSFPRPTASGSAGPCSVTGPATRRRARQPQPARGGPWPPGRRPASAWIGAL